MIKDDIKLEFYVLNHDFNTRKIENFNIFRNSILLKRTLEEVKKYVESPKDYTYRRSIDGIMLKGFEAFCFRLETLIACEEWSRCEYEIYVGDAFTTDINKFEKWDCFMQAKPNVPIIAREVIYQYKEQTKKRRSKKKKGESNEENI